MNEVFFKIHTDLPRQGPGDSASTTRAFAMLRNLPEIPDILDIGCGPGMQTLDLTKLTKGRIIAVDNHQPYLNALHKKAMEQGSADRIQVVNADMLSLDFQAQSFDVIWAEGSIYIIGFEKGLRVWEPLLKKRGYLAVTELTWLKPNAPLEVRQFWQEGYPAMQDIAGNLKIINDTEYGFIGHFAIPASAWWENYYTPLQKRLTRLWEKYKDNDEAIEILEMEQTEIDLFRKYSDYYGYVFYVMRQVTS